MVFLTNNLEWSPGSLAQLYRCRWQIEAFFKQIKQTLQLADFLGNNANAVKWQQGMALLVYVLLRFQVWQGSSDAQPLAAAHPAARRTLMAGPPMGRL